MRSLRPFQATILQEVAFQRWAKKDDQIADLEFPDLSAHPFGGWSERTGKQYDVDTEGHVPMLPGFGEVDLERRHD